MEYTNSIAYYEVEKKLDKLITESGLEIEGWDNADYEIIEKIASNLDAWDYCFSIAIGLVAPFISTNEELQDYLKEIHNAASEATGEYDFLQKALGCLLHHKGDPIDQIDRKFIKRDREGAYVLFHRLLWGHDIFSIKSDNPFFLMVKKQGLSGVIQALQHLLADTTSKQGLPFPGSSYLDFVEEDGTLSNYLINLAQDLSVSAVGNKRAAQEIYSHMFTIRAADILGAGSNAVLSKMYFKIRNIDDGIRKHQFSLISYSISFWGQALIGLGRFGVPYINFPVGADMVKSFVSLYASSLSRMRKLMRKGRILTQETDRLIVVSGNDFCTDSVGTKKLDVQEEFERSQKNAKSLMQTWEENLNNDGQ